MSEGENIRENSEYSQDIVSKHDYIWKKKPVRFEWSSIIKFNKPKNKLIKGITVMLIVIEPSFAEK